MMSMPMTDFTVMVLGVAVLALIVIWAGNRAIWRWERKRALRRRLEEVTNGYK